MPVEAIYRTKAQATGGRDGRARSLEGPLDVALSVPKEMGGPGGDGTNPEQLFAAGYAACFLGALKYTAGQRKIRISPEANVEATVGIGPDGSGAFGIEVALAVTLPGLDRDVAQDLTDTAHRVCPYSNATRGNIDVTVTLT